MRSRTSEDGLLVLPVEEDACHWKALIIGPPNTPYAYGFFTFDVKFGAEYPATPPSIRIETTDGGRTRFHPNLYANGLVCLSILGTWPGEKWAPSLNGASALLSVASLLGSDNPITNEPGFESGVDHARNEAYNAKVVHETLRVSVLDSLSNPTHPFAPLLAHFFRLYLPHYQRTLHANSRRAGPFAQMEFEGETNRMAGSFSYEALAQRVADIAAHNETETQRWRDAPADDPNAMKTTFQAARKALRKEGVHILRTAPCVWLATFIVDESAGALDWCGVIPPLEVVVHPAHGSTGETDDVPRLRFQGAVFHPCVSSAGIPFTAPSPFRTADVVFHILSAKDLLFKVLSLLLPARESGSGGETERQKRL